MVVLPVLFRGAVFRPLSFWAVLFLLLFSVGSFEFDLFMQVYSLNLTNIGTCSAM